MKFFLNSLYVLFYNFGSQLWLFVILRGFVLIINCLQLEYPLFYPIRYSPSPHLKGKNFGTFSPLIKS